MKKKIVWTVLALAAALAAASAYFATSGTRITDTGRLDSAAPAGGTPAPTSTDNRF